jgi:hypothetical protein
MNLTTTVSRVLATLAATALVATGCSSGGGGSAPDTATLTAKLKKDPTIKQLESSVAGKTDKIDQIIGCIASALQKDGNPDDLNKYVAGKIDLTDVGGKPGVSEKKAETDTQNCVQDALGSS